MDQQNSSVRSRRVRGALLASVFTLGIAGATGAGALLSGGPVANAEQLQVQNAGPADFTSIIDTVKPAVVSVQVKTNEDVSDNSSGPGMDNIPPEFRDFFRRFGEQQGQDDQGQGPARPRHPRFGMSQGSGFFVSGDGYLVTNNHVVEGGRDIKVLTDDGRELDAKLIGTDKRTDLALLKVEGHDFKYVKLSQDEPKVGQWVLAVGNPFGLGGTVTAGIISADHRDIGSGPYDNYIQIDAPVNRGNSGGPTFNTRGEVVGVNTAIYSPSGGNVGIAFAIPASTVANIVEDLKNKGVVTRGWLGVQIQPVTADIAKSLGVQGTEGAIVADAQANSPAEKAGIKAGDIITKINGNPVKDPKTLSQRIAGMNPDDKVSVTVLRDGKDMDVDVTLGNLNQLDKTELAKADNNDQQEQAQPGSLDGLGITVEKNKNGDGVVVTGVEDSSAASDKGIQTGDVIVAVGGKPVSSVSDLQKGVSAAKKDGRGAVLLKVQGENGGRFVGVPFDRG